MLDFDSTNSALAKLRQAHKARLAATTDYADVRTELRENAGLATARDTDPQAILVPFLDWMQGRAESVCRVAGGDVSLDMEAFEAHLSNNCGFKRPPLERFERSPELFPLLSAGLLDGSVTPRDCWEGMVSVLRSDDIVSVALSETARELSLLFGRSLVGKVRRTSGKISVRHSASMDDHWKDKVSYYTARDFNKAVSGLIAVAEWAGLDGVANSLHAGPRVVDNHHEVETRAQYPLGAGVSLVTFKSSFEYRLPEELGVALGQFVHKYAADTMKRYAA